MTTPTVFTHEAFGSVRTETIEGTPYFCARDIAVALGFASPADSVRRHCIRVADSSTLFYQNQPLKIIPESDVYRLVMRSNLPSAQQFQDWVCEEVLPAIRQTGRYQQEPMSELAMIAAIATAAEEQRVRLLQQQEQLTQVEHRVEQLESQLEGAEVPEGYMFISEVHSRYAHYMTEKKARATLGAIEWPSESVSIVRDGIRRNCTVYKTNLESAWHRITSIEELFRVISFEARQVSAYYYTHDFVPGRFQINLL